jgi:Ulp1 family protease
MDGQPHRGTITIFKSDVDLLEEGQKLNDSLVEFYLKYLQLNAR